MWRIDGATGFALTRGDPTLFFQFGKSAEVIVPRQWHGKDQTLHANESLWLYSKYRDSQSRYIIVGTDSVRIGWNPKVTGQSRAAVCTTRKPKQ